MMHFNIRIGVTHRNYFEGKQDIKIIPRIIITHNLVFFNHSLWKIGCNLLSTIQAFMVFP